MPKLPKLGEARSKLLCELLPPQQHFALVSAFQRAAREDVELTREQAQQTLDAIRRAIPEKELFARQQPKDRRDDALRMLHDLQELDTLFSRILSG